jgi:hypothetical protein
MCSVTGNATWIDENTTHKTSGLSATRWLLGGLAIALNLVVAGLFAAGAWNPWQLVVLRENFANPWLGLAIVCAGVYVTLWLLTPIRNEARQPGRLWARAITVLIGVLGLLLWGLFAHTYAYDATEIAVSDDGERTVVDVTAGGLNERTLRVYEGVGLAAREVAQLGRPCGGVSAEFAGRDVVLVDQGHGPWEFHLDPASGQSLHEFGPRCSDGPVPATMD